MHELFLECRMHYFFIPDDQFNEQVSAKVK